MTRHDDITPEQFVADRLDVPPEDLPNEEIVFLGVSVEGEPELPRRPLGITIEGTNSPVTEGDTMWVTALVENTGSERLEPSVEGVVREDGSGSLLGPGRKTVRPSLDPGGAACLTFTWETGPGDGGTYEATVSSGDGDGGTTTASQTVEVRANSPPTVSITGPGGNSPQGGELGVPIDSTDDFGDKTFTADASDPDGSVESYQWVVGGETAGTGPEVTISFAASEAFRRQLRVLVTDGAGMIGVASASVFADLSDAELGERFSGADLSGADLSGADLSNANLGGIANLKRADLTGADLTGADLPLPEMRRADLTDVNLSGANLRGAGLTFGNLSGADLSGADLSGGFLIDAFLLDADFTNADMTGVIGLGSGSGAASAKSTADFTGTRFEGDF